MSAVDVLTAGGIVRPADVVELAAAAHLDLACAAVLLVKESGGGKCIWGHDEVDPMSRDAEVAQLGQELRETQRRNNFSAMVQRAIARTAQEGR